MSENKLFGVNLEIDENEKTIINFFAKIKGVSTKNINKIFLLNCGFLLKKKINKELLSNDMFTKIEIILKKNNKKILGDVFKKFNIAYQLDFLQKRNTYKELRKKQNLPCRGQRTKTNAQTCKKRNKNKIKRIYSLKKK